mgnify:CR=1 FL=1
MALNGTDINLGKFRIYHIFKHGKMINIGVILTQL